MNKSQRLSMQCLPGTNIKTVLDKLFVLRKCCTTKYLITTIIGIAKNWMANIFHMNANLMCPTSLETALNQTHISQFFKDFKMSNCVFTEIAIRENGKYLSVFQTSANVTHNSTFRFFRNSPNQCLISAL